MNFYLKRTFLFLLTVMGFSLLSRSEEQRPIIYYDMTPLFKLDFKNPDDLRRFYDETLLVASLQGLVNREEPRLYIRYNAAPDDFWKKRMTEPGGWLSGRSFVQIDQLEELLRHFAGSYQGAVVWDEAVPATSNAAATIAGCDNLLSIRYDQNPQSVYQRFIASGLQIPVQKRLIHEDGLAMFTGKGTIPQTEVSSSGSAKCDVYLWLIEQYIKTGKVNPKLLGYYL
ncbi:MAG: GxGYxYP domain-containing protein, partial [Candidatus Hinthialibacter sp.]